MVDLPPLAKRLANIIAQVRFRFDSTIFARDVSYSPDVIATRLHELAFLNSSVTIRFRATRKGKAVPGKSRYLPAARAAAAAAAAAHDSTAAPANEGEQGVSVKRGSKKRKTGSASDAEGDAAAAGSSGASSNGNGNVVAAAAAGQYGAIRQDGQWQVFQYSGGLREFVACVQVGGRAGRWWMGGGGSAINPTSVRPAVAPCVRCAAMTYDGLDNGTKRLPALAAVRLRRQAAPRTAPQHTRHWHDCRYYGDSWRVRRTLPHGRLATRPSTSRSTCRAPTRLRGSWWRRRCSGRGTRTRRRWGAGPVLRPVQGLGPVSCACRSRGLSSGAEHGGDERGNYGS